MKALLAAMYTVLLFVGEQSPPRERPAAPPKGDEGNAGSVILDGDAVTTGGMPKRLIDPSFDRYVHFAELLDAVNSRDASRLTDAALLTAEAERVLQRTHRSGVTAKQVLALAYEMARQDDNKQAVGRVTKLIESRGEKPPAPDDRASFAEQFATNKAPKVAPDISPKTLKLFQGLRDEVKTAVLLRDQVRLARLKRIVPAQAALPKEMRTWLLQSVERGEKVASTAAAADARPLATLLLEAQAAASAIFYEHSWGGGATYTIYGTYSRSNMPDTWNDVVSSLWVRRGYLVYCYQHVNYGGARCWVLVNGDGSPGSSPSRDKTPEQAGWLFEMSSHNWNDVISSFQVQLR